MTPIEQHWEALYFSLSEPFVEEFSSIPNAVLLAMGIPHSYIHEERFLKETPLFIAEAYLEEVILPTLEVTKELMRNGV